jgi:hypothetical protein
MTRACVAPPPQIDKNVEREILNHRMLNNPHVIAFREVRIARVVCHATTCQRNDVALGSRPPGGGGCIHLAVQQCAAASKGPSTG